MGWGKKLRIKKEKGGKRMDKGGRKRGKMWNLIFISRFWLAQETKRNISSLVPVFGIRSNCFLILLCNLLCNIIWFRLDTICAKIK